MFRTIKQLGAVAMVASTLTAIPFVAQAQDGIRVIQGPAQTVDMAQFIEGVWYTEDGESKQLHQFDGKGGWQMASYMESATNPFYAGGGYTLDQIDARLYTLTISVNLPDGDLEIPDTVMVGQDMKSIVSVETGGIFMRVEDDTEG